MSVTVQSSNLSSFAPKLIVYNSSLGLVNQASASNSFGATISTSTSVTARQTYFIKVLAAGGPGPVGGYGLLVNFGSKSQPPIPPPNTVVPSAPDQGGGTSNDLAPTGGALSSGGGRNTSPWASGGQWISCGNLSGWALGLQCSAGKSGQPGSSFGGQPASAPWSPETPGGPIGALPDAGATAAPLFSGSNTGASQAPGNSSAAALGTTPTVLQAVDDALASWVSQS
jgi:hypothetical protein